ncbi:MAG: DNA repair protein RadC [Bacteroidia bacterium]|nr:DNA repair protein RadC [Bacteroidia bacterium]
MSENNQPIRLWAEDDRPREKLLNKGRHSLSDSELLAILLGSGTSKKSAVDVARDVLSLAGNNLNELARLDIKALCKAEGIGPAKAITIIAAIELGGRREASLAKEKTKVACSKDSYNLLRYKMEGLYHEEFWVITLSRANKVINEHKISEGGMTGTVADPKRIFSTALNDNACSVILCHNHPSGNLKPSQEDINLTKKLREGGKMLDIVVVDHIIIGEKGYYSFADEGMMV